MTRRLLIAACCVFLAAPALFAQSRGAKSDPLSGTWKGELNVPDAQGPVPITMQLKFDGKSGVTGTFSGLPRPGDVKSGTFDPKTGSLKLQLGKTGETEVLITLEGTVVKDTASGRVSGEAGNGDFKLAKKE